MNTQADLASARALKQRAMPYGLAAGVIGGLVMVLMLNSPDLLKSIFFFVFGGLIWWRIGFAIMHFLFRKVLK